MQDPKLATSPPRELRGTVFKKTLGHYVVRLDGREVVCSISSRLRRKLLYPTASPNSVRRRVVDVRDIEEVDPVAVGDEVAFVEGDGDAGVIMDVLPRRSKLSRLASGSKPIEQVIVANVDQVIPVFAAAEPAPKWGMLDRYLVSAEAAGLPAVICLTKWDLATDRLNEVVETYRRIGYEVLVTSTVTGEGIATFAERLRGRTSVFVGKSGVGKTSLLNAIQPELGLRVREISRNTGKGRHTTTALEMFEMDMGGRVVDTPGMREIGLWHVDGTDLASLFPEMRPHVGRCKFGATCSHTHEPGCRIKRAVRVGTISALRYRSYQTIRR